MKKRSLVLDSVQAAAGRGIVIQITGDGESAKQALQMVQQKMRETEAASDRVAASTRRFAESTEHMVPATAAASAGLRALEGNFTNNIRAGERFLSMLPGMGTALQAAFPVVGGIVLLTALVNNLRELTQGSLDLGEALSRAHVQTGLTVESLSVLRYGAKVTGGDFEGLTSSLSKMNNTIAKAAEGDAKASGFMRSLGLDAKDVASKANGTEIAFQAFLKTLAATESPVERTRLAMGLLGKTGATMIPTLLDMAQHWDVLKQKAQDAGQLMDGETAESLAETNRRLKDLQMTVEGLGIAFTTGMTGPMRQVLDVLREGKSDRDLFVEWGHNVARSIAAAASAIYMLKSGVYGLAQIGDVLNPVGAALHPQKTLEALRENRKEQVEADEKSKKMMDIALGRSGNPQPFLSSPTPIAPGARPFDGSELEKHAKAAGDHAASLNAISSAAAHLAEQQAQVALASQKAAGAAQLAEVEAQHKLLLMSDQEFYDRKFKLQNDAFDAEQAKLTQDEKTLQNLLERQHADKSLKRDQQGHSAEEYKTQADLLKLKEQQEQLDGRRRAAESGYNAEVGAAGMAAELNSLRVAAQLERERNSGIEAQIALIRREHEEQAKKSTLAGGSEQDAAAIKASGELAVQRLQLGQVTEQITAVENDHRRAVDAVNDAVTKGDLSKRSASQRIREANAEEQQQLQQLVQQYRQLADAIGDPALLEKAKDLQASLDDMGRPDHRGTFGKEVVDGMEQMTTSLAEQAALGKATVGQMVDSMLQDMARLAMKMAEEKFLAPLFEKALGGGDDDDDSGGGGFLSTLFEHHLSGGVGSDGPQVVGERGPEIWKPPTRGGSYLTNDTLKGLATSGGGGGKAPNVSFNVTNQSSQPVQAYPGHMSYDADAREFIQHVILTDAHEGGPISQARG